MKKIDYTPPEFLVIPMRMESVLCTSGTGESMDPWENDGPAFAPSFMDFDSIL